MSNTPTLFDRLSHFDTVRDWANTFGKQTKEQQTQDVKNKQQPSGPVTRDTYKSMATGQPAPEEYDKKLANVQVAQKLKNPFDAPNPQLQLTAHGAKLTRLMSDPKYQGLNDNMKLIVLRHYYNKYTEPILKANGIEAPGFERWASGQHSESTDTRFAEQSKEAKPTITGAFTSGVAEGTADLTRIIGNGLRYRVPWQPKFTTDINRAAAEKLSRVTNGLDTLDQTYHSTFQTDHSVSGWLANTTGHVIGEAPAYVILDAATSGVAPTLSALTKTAPKMAKALTYMKEAGEIFAIDKAENKSTRTATSDATLGPLIGFGLRGAAGLVRKPLNAAGDAFLKRVNAKGTQLAVMGKPLTNTIEAEAERLQGTSSEVAPKTESFIKKSDADIQQAAMNEVHLRESVSRDYYGHKVDPENPDKSIWRNLSKGQRDKVRQYIANITKVSAETMPLTSPHVQTLANETELEQWIKSDPSNDAIVKTIQKITGINPAEALTEVQAETVAQKKGINTPTQHLDQAFHGAEENPEPKGGASSSAQLPSNLRFAKPRVGDMTPQFKSDVDKALYIVGNRWNKAGERASSKSDSQYMDFLRKQFPGMSDYAIQEKGRVLKDRVVDIWKNTDKNAYEFDVPASEDLPSVSGGSGRLKSGYAVDYNRRNDNANIKETVTDNAEGFINKTMKYLPDSKATKSGKIYFEHPEHHLLWIAQNSNAPSAIKSKAEGFLAREFAHDQGTINRRAGWLKEHVADLERTGHIKKEGNVYRSTRLQQRRYGTKWQSEVYSPETFDAQMKQVRALIKSQPKLKAVFSPMIKDLIAFKNKGAKPETVAERAQGLEDMVKDFKKKNRIK